MSIVQRLTANIVQANARKENAALVKKWEETGLLEGLEDTGRNNDRTNMAILLENQAKELLREMTSMAAGDVEGFAAVAFPMVRRTFGELVASELVSVQPMKLPTGLIYFMDFVAGTDKGVGHVKGESIYGGGVLARQIVDGVDLEGVNLEKGLYSLNNGYASPTGSASVDLDTPGVSGTAGAGDLLIDQATQFDPDLSGSFVSVYAVNKSEFPQMNFDNMVALTDQSSVSGTLIRRLTRTSPVDPTKVLLVYSSSAEQDLVDLTGSARTFKFPINDDFASGNGLGSLKGDPTWGFEFGNNAGENAEIPEIDLKIDSIDIRAVTKKLKTKWTPELGQDLDAYHNIDAESELTSVLSEQVGLEIEQEILGDLVQGALKANNKNVLYWSRRPGKFLDRTTGETLGSTNQGDFTGNVWEWYQTLVETINDCSAQIFRRVLRGGANFIVCGPEVASILEGTQGFAADVGNEGDSGTAGTTKIGAVSKKFDIYVSAHFYRNVILVGRRGSSFLESGYVYSPYVPLQTTPVIYDPDKFIPNKGVMTRYGKKLVRADMYGLVIVRDLAG